jgi:error-prone DNA polymerase
VSSREPTPSRADVCELTLIRPGPIQGGAVRRFVRADDRPRPITYPHPLLEAVLDRIKGVPLFQE